MAETTDQYKNRISQIKTSIENEPEIVKMREDIAEGISKTGNRQADIEVRQGTLEEDFVKVQQDASSVSPSGAEVAVARGEYSTLDGRLTAEQNKVNAQLARTVTEEELMSAVAPKADQSFVDSQFASIVRGAPTGTFSTLNALKLTYPNGNDGVMLVLENGHWYYWHRDLKTWDDGGVYQSSGIADNSVTSKKRTSLGDVAVCQFYGEKTYINFDFEKNVVTIPMDTNIVYKNNHIILPSDVEVTLLSENVSFMVLYLNTDNMTFEVTRYINTLAENKLLVAMINRERQQISMLGNYRINSAALTNPINATIAYSNGEVTYKRNGSDLIVSVNTRQLFIKTQYGNLAITMDTSTITVPHNYSWVVDINDNSYHVINSDNINRGKHIVLLSAHQGLPKYTALYLNMYDYGGISMHYSGKIYKQRENKDVRFIFKGYRAYDMFYYKTHGLSKNFLINTSNVVDDSSRSILVQHNQSLVINVSENTFNVIDSSNIEYQNHILLFSVHEGNVKYSNGILVEDLDNLFYKRLITSNTSPTTQDGCIVNNQIWLFEDGKETQDGNSKVYKMDLVTHEVISEFNHDLGHCNGVDYYHNHLVIYNGGGEPPEIDLFWDVSNDITNLSVDDVNHQKIVFSEGEKVLEGDGTACFGENERIIYYISRSRIYKILLGMGDNDLSDKSIDKSDVNYFGVFIAGRSENEYNGTAKILEIYDGEDITQPQGCAFDGYLYVGTGFDNLNYKKIKLSNGSYHVKQHVVADVRNYKNEKVVFETQAIMVNKNNVLLVGKDVEANGVIVSISN